MIWRGSKCKGFSGSHCDFYSVEIYVNISKQGSNHVPVTISP